MPRLLMLASVASMIDNFNMANIRLLKTRGCEVEVACNFSSGSTMTAEWVDALRHDLHLMEVPCHQVDIARDPLRIDQHLHAIRQVRKLVHHGRFTHLHCHSPIGGAVARAAAVGTGTQVLYTAHGFHFYRGAPARNWMMYYPLERGMAKLTDTLLTMNKEDFGRASKFGARNTRYVPGVGVDIDSFHLDEEARRRSRCQLDIRDERITLVAVGELSRRKNHEVVIRALARLPELPVDFIIAGLGPLEHQLESLASELGVSHRVRLLGYQRDVAGILGAADIFVFPSIHEGLPVALMEAMAAGLPVIASRIRGNVDLVNHGEGGVLIDPHDSRGLSKAIFTLASDSKTRDNMGLINQSKVREFSTEVVQDHMLRVYRQSGAIS